jgi:hypothetical protein
MKNPFLIICLLTFMANSVADIMAAQQPPKRAKIERIKVEDDEKKEVEETLPDLPDLEADDEEEEWNLIDADLPPFNSQITLLGNRFTYKIEFFKTKNIPYCDSVTLECSGCFDDDHHFNVCFFMIKDASNITHVTFVTYETVLKINQQGVNTAVASNYLINSMDFDGKPNKKSLIRWCLQNFTAFYMILIENRETLIKLQCASPNCKNPITQLLESGDLKIFNRVYLSCKHIFCSQCANRNYPTKCPKTNCERLLSKKDILGGTHFTFSPK